MNTFKNDILFTWAELEITVSLDENGDAEVFLNNGSHPITDLLDAELLDSLRIDWIECKADKIKEEKEMEGDYRMEEARDRALDQI